LWSRPTTPLAFGRLAISLSQQGQGLGKSLISLAFIKTAEIAKNAGVTGLFLDGKDDALTAFYARFGFESLPATPLAMFMPIGQFLNPVDKE
jgi:predicted N-acetyltransferase YhbS